MDKLNVQSPISEQPSFASEVKAEICSRKDRGLEASIALLSGFIKVNGNLLVRDNNWVINIKTDNTKIAKLIYSLVKDIFKAEAQILISETNRFKKDKELNRSIIVEISTNVKDMLKTLEIYDEKSGFDNLPSNELLNSNELKREYITGSFLASGSVNSPNTSNYHLEVGTPNLEHANYIVDLLNKFYISSKVTTRRKQHIVYIKRSEAIGDFLKVVSAFNSLMTFENIRIQRDQLNSANRIYNCDIANEMKAVSKGIEQQIKIKYLESKVGLDSLDPKYQRVAELRLAHPEACLSDLVELHFEQNNERISKSGINHRLQKILEIADKLKGAK
jgi:cell division protein WhiA